LIEVLEDTRQRYAENELGFTYRLDDDA
jgi:hypothetical protein